MDVLTGRAIDPAIHHRRSLRLKGYDYSQAGAYFITICVHNRECLLGKIVGAGPRACPQLRNYGELPVLDLSDVGRMVQAVWDEIPAHYPGVDVDAFIVMPNHVHGIIVLDALHGQSSPIGEQPRVSIRTMGLGDVVHRFKSLTAAWYRKAVGKYGGPPFPGRMWQRNYYEHIIRDDDELNHVRQYIQDNPARWAEDENNPAVLGAGAQR